MITKIEDIFTLEESKKILEEIISENYGQSRTGADIRGLNGTLFENSITKFNKVLKPLNFCLMLLNQAKKTEEKLNKTFIISLPDSNSNSLDSLFKEFNNINSKYCESDVILCSIVSDDTYKIIDARSLKTCLSGILTLNNDATGNKYDKCKVEQDTNEEEISDQLLTSEVLQSFNESKKLETTLGKILIAVIDDTDEKCVHVRLFETSKSIEEIEEILKKEEGYSRKRTNKSIQIKIKNPKTNKLNIAFQLTDRKTAATGTSWERGIKIKTFIIDKICTLIHEFKFDGDEEIKKSVIARLNGEY